MLGVAVMLGIAPVEDEGVGSADSERVEEGEIGEADPVPDAVRVPDKEGGI
jgi:hypothetical protein